MKQLRKLALITTAFTYFLIFIGGLVRVAGAGLGCPDWPRCFGRWIPPLSPDQLPPAFDPSTFNLTLAWIEYVNRLVGVLDGFLLLGLAIVIVKGFRQERRLLVPAIAALVLVALQGWQGSVVVAMGLDPDVVNIHLYTALIIVALLVYVTQQTFYLDPERQDESDTAYPGNLRWTLFGFLVIVAVQILSGSQVRGGFELLQQTLRFVKHMGVMELIGAGMHFHLWTGVAVFLLSGVLIYQLRYRSTRISPAMKMGSILVIFLLGLQVLLGFGLLRIGLPPIMQLFHLWIGSMILGALLVMLAAFGQYTRRSHGV